LRSPTPNFGARFDATACTGTALHTLIVVNGAATDHRRAESIIAERWLLISPPIS